MCAGECVCRPLTLTQRVPWAQGLGGHAAVHGQIERLLHFGPDDSVRERRKAIERRRKQDQWLPGSSRLLKSPSGVLNAPHTQPVHLKPMTSPLTAGPSGVPMSWVALSVTRGLTPASLPPSASNRPRCYDLTCDLPALVPLCISLLVPPCASPPTLSLQVIHATPSPPDLSSLFSLLQANRTF